MACKSLNKTIELSILGFVFPISDITHRRYEIAKLEPVAYEAWWVKHFFLSLSLSLDGGLRWFKQKSANNKKNTTLSSTRGLQARENIKNLFMHTQPKPLFLSSLSFMFSPSRSSLVSKHRNFYTPLAPPFEENRTSTRPEREREPNECYSDSYFSAFTFTFARVVLVALDTQQLYAL